MKHSQARLFTARYNGNVLAAWVVFSLNNVLYYPYGASSAENRNVMASNLLAWEVIRWAKKRGMTSFDMWGALGHDPDPKDPWYGFHRFKQGYGPEHVHLAGSYDLVIDPILYRLFM